MHLGCYSQFFPPFPPAMHSPASIHSFYSHSPLWDSHMAILAPSVTHRLSGAHPWLPFSFPTWAYIFCTLICIFYPFDLQYFFNMTIRSLFKRLIWVHSCINWVRVEGDKGCTLEKGLQTKSLECKPMAHGLFALVKPVLFTSPMESQITWDS